MAHYKCISQDNYTNEVTASTLPILFCCLEGKIFDEDQYDILETIGHLFQGRIQICTNQRGEKKFFSKKFNILGAPFFLFLSQGKVVDTLLGATGQEELELFVSKNLKT